VIGTSDQFVAEALEDCFLESLDLSKPSDCILKMREKLWCEYLVKEEQSVQPCLNEVFSKNKNPEVQEMAAKYFKIIKNMPERESSEKNELQMIEFAAKVSARYFHDIYELSKSFSQARRSRAGQEFQNIISILMRLYKFEYDSQAKLGKGRFKEIGLKMVDGIFPGIDCFSVSKQNCCVLTLKTTLRERWQEVVDEIKRVNIPSIFLLTLDKNITSGMLELMHEHNILLVTLQDHKKQFSGVSHVFSFEEFFGEVLPEKQKWWGRQNKT
jgi:hypothetical protein